MNYLARVIQALGIIFFFLGAVLSVEYIISSHIGYALHHVPYALVMLVVLKYLVIGTLEHVFFLLQTSVPLTGRALWFGARITSLWLSLALVICVILRLDFSPRGLSLALLFFLAPTEVVHRFYPIDMTFMPGLVLGNVLFFLGVLVAALLLMDRKKRKEHA